MDPNATRYHYRRASQTLARRKFARKALDWLILWAIVAAVCFAICSK